MLCDMYDRSRNSVEASYIIGLVSIERAKYWVNFCLEEDGKYLKMEEFIGSVYKSMI
ncbi:hypothetical protein MtrunA17_Chr3g0143761 [Medicago truncatula]|uniref:Uncharacterized protein n=1 Tax=Medicago truncatula TaxID=3880 RepID=A0A396J090_MEDTR|nr:hypothetical protein MtrunA17_Chr3g0143761 [Medicago truncatula]